VDGKLAGVFDKQLFDSEKVRIVVDAKDSVPGRQDEPP
jgi:hypothetical protein